MRLRKIIEGLDVVKVSNFKNYNISSITHISQEVIKDSVFICIKGNEYDGNRYIDDAIRLGAKCIVTEDDSVVCSATIIVVKNIRIAMSAMAKNFYNRCCDDLEIIAVVGTAGKTTTSILIAQMLSNLDNNIGVIGTNGIYIKGIRQENKFTTPDPIDLHYIFFQMKMLGVGRVVMEVSAQAIYYYKVFGIKFRIAVFTNISREHLDFFGSYENYVKTKMSFFTSGNVEQAVINVDDFYGRELAYKCNIPVISYGVREPANSFALDIVYGLEQTKFVANILDDVIELSAPFVGEYSVYNLISSMTVCKLLGLDGIKLKQCVDNLKVIDGRYNVYNKGYKKFIIDFAHTPNSVESLLSHIRVNTKGKIISVFGCVGYSDRDKRKDMGRVVSNYSDYIVITTDNIGMAIFQDVCQDIICGVGQVGYVCIEDRKTAINYAYGLMNDGDVLVCIGKGAEDFQMIGKTRIPYSDKECILEILNS